MAGLVNALLGSRLKLAFAAPTKPAASAPRQVTSMAKKKGVRCIVTLECTEARQEGGTPSRYVTQKVPALNHCRHALPSPGLDAHHDCGRHVRSLSPLQQR